MPKIDFCFQGWVRGAEVTKATGIVDGKPVTVDVSKMSSKKLTKKLDSGELLISLGDFLYDDNDDCSIEIHDFEPTD